ncbi:sigma-70 family RNA polymerase sigma factor [Bacillus sp. FJAT-29814]|uniref:sigma-70 family RNA polymerase sigma factor n=1 Tax=Bacillus sp. FJAT-29814 TaxID=1729688 RepID=UPI00082A0A2D|nr:sigma-70 family RNA polymerase sigma factor [Bacillus sp. FJAT-29814]
MKLNKPKDPHHLDISSIKKETLLEELIETYGNKVLKLAFTYVKDQKVAEDITQEVFIKCFQNWEKFRGDSSVKTWLYSITINTCKDYLKSWSFRNLLFHDFTPKQKDMKDHVLEHVLERSQKKELASAVLNLPVKYREVMILFYYENYRVEEISKFLQINENTIRTRLKRGKGLLFKKLGKEMRDEL